MDRDAAVPSDGPLPQDMSQHDPPSTSSHTLHIHPSSFSHTLTSHPYMTQHNIRSPHGAPIPASNTNAPTAFSLAAPLTFNTQISTASSASSSASTTHHTSSSSSSSLYNARSPGAIGTSSMNPSKKRSSDQFDASHTTSPLTQPAAKHTRTDSDDEENDVLGMNMMDGSASSSPPAHDETHRSNGLAVFHPITEEEEDSSFMSLLNKLASLDFPDRDSQLEQCPLCPNKFPLSEFAAHVYTCIRQLDDDERKEQERLDEKLATEMTYGPRSRRYMRAITPEAAADVEAQLLERFASSNDEHCIDGANCKRVDAQHFVLKWHPSVECPICGDKFHMSEINAHVTFCLEAPAPRNKSTDNQDMTDAGSTAASAVPATGTTTAPSSASFSSAPIVLPVAAGSRPARRSRSRRMGQRSASVSDVAQSVQPVESLLCSPDDRDDDYDASSEDESNVPASQPPSSHTAMHRSNSDCQLSLAQASAVASAILKRKVGPSSSSSREGVVGPSGDPSLVDLLNTFSSLGFTKDKLAALHAKHEQEQQENKTQQ